MPSGTMKLHGQAQDPPKQIPLTEAQIHLNPAPGEEINTKARQSFSIYRA